MPRGYDRPLYILPFDHRHSYGADVFGYHEPMTPDEIADVAASKQVIYEGFRLALAKGVPQEKAGILVDEEFGAAILRDAKARGYAFAMPTEKSGQHEFDFEHGEQFGEALLKYGPTFAKVLVRYNPDGDAGMNTRQTVRLKQISDFVAGSAMRLMFELLVPPEPAQLEQVGGSQKRYDAELRPALVERALRALQDAGIEPDVWKIEGLETRDDCQRVVEVARRDGREQVGCIVLGRGENEAKVVEWLQTAAGVKGFIGFAVGRSTFLDAIVGLRAGKLAREAAVEQIAERYREWVRVFEGRERPTANVP